MKCIMPANMIFNNSIMKPNTEILFTLVAQEEQPLLFFPLQMAYIYFSSMSVDVAQLVTYLWVLFYVILWISDRVTPHSLHHPPRLPANTQDTIFITLP